MDPDGEGQLSPHETVSLAGRHTEWLLRLAAAPGIDARAGGPPPEGAGPGVIRREQAAVRQSPYSRGSDRARRAGQPEARDPVDAGRRPEGAHPQTVHVDHDERSRPAGGRESPRPAVRSRRTESALGRGHDRVCHRLERQALSRRRPRPVLAICGRLGRERRQRSPPDHQGAGDGAETTVPGDRPVAPLRPGLHVRERGLPGAPGCARDRLQHEPPG